MTQDLFPEPATEHLPTHQRELIEDLKRYSYTQHLQMTCAHLKMTEEECGQLKSLAQKYFKLKKDDQENP